MLKEFKTFIAQGNVLDLAVGVIIGAAFGKITTSLVDDIIMPLVAFVAGDSLNPKGGLVLKEAIGDKAAIVVNYGSFISTVINFLIIAWVVFMIVKAANRIKGPSTEK